MHKNKIEKRENMNQNTMNNYSNTLFNELTFYCGYQLYFKNFSQHLYWYILCQFFWLGIKYQAALCSLPRVFLSHLIRTEKALILGLCSSFRETVFPGNNRWCSVILGTRETSCRELEASLTGFLHSSGNSYWNANMERILKEKNQHLLKNVHYSLKRILCGIVFPY